MWLTAGTHAIAIAIGASIMIASVLIGFRKYSAGMPLVSTCSAVISAACHQPWPHDKEAHLFPVRWGEQSGDPGSGVGHYCFTTQRDIKRPVAGRYYD